MYLLVTFTDSQNIRILKHVCVCACVRACVRVCVPTAIQAHTLANNTAASMNKTVCNVERKQ